ncbi:sulfite exporter TauE/SafE family protein [Natronosporangium hydrolyticum]|uniref:Probable membrane transporter protein n=1 Tax=Natronosporangium hydrolyticum TaxID=2811111 RepID=A0A895YFI6_9ACTN|nr:sulfite exporter TauE/SafE family protein [Natronosporangium hydrolyticum]QSB14882.1 sulfite exporter TauE/SafE family protein [Natronosporangium hydrolyticum]
MVPLLLTGFAIVLLAAAVQAVTGFGFALVAVPLLALTNDPRTAVVAVGIAGMLMSIMVALTERRYARWRLALPLIGASAAGMPLGLLVLAQAPERVLLVLIGAAVVGCAVLIWRGLRIAGGWPVAVAVGVFAGSLSTSTGTNGPPLVAAFAGMEMAPREFRATLAAVFTGTGVLSLVGFALAGQLTGAAAQVGLVGVPAAVAGWWLGNLLFRRLPTGSFRRIVLAALVASGVLTAAPALAG